MDERAVMRNAGAIHSVDVETGVASVQTREMQLDEMADLHHRLGRCETMDVALSRRITALEESGRGHYDDDPMKSMMPLVWVMILLTVAPMVVELVAQWKRSES